MINYDLQIAKGMGDRDKLKVLKYILYIESFKISLKLNNLKDIQKNEINYLISTIYKELGLYKKSIRQLNTLFKKNKDSNFFLISLLSSIKKCGAQDNYYLELIQLFNSRIDNKDYYYYGNSTKKITEVIKKHGFIIIKNFFDKKKINEMKENFESNIENSKSVLKSIGKDPHNCIYPLFMINNYNSEKIKNKIKKSSKDNWHFDKYFENSDSIYLNDHIINRFKDSFLNQLISNYVENNQWKLYSDYSMSRKISDYGFEKEGYAGLHQDSRLTLLYKHYLTFWIPFCKSGNGYAPTLDVIPTYCKNYFPYEYYFDPNNISRQKLSIRDFPDECVLSPNVDLGDLWIHDSFTLHGTSVNKNNFGSRHSIDLRFF